MAKKKSSEPKSSGRCELCGKPFPKASMGKHLVACRKAHPAAAGKNRKAASAYLLAVEGRHAPDYWMFLEMPQSAELIDLDDFLRATWLECCGHLSEFKIGDVAYVPDAAIDGGAFDEDFGFGDGDSMEAELSDVLSVGDKFDYTYDFGTSTELKLRVVAEYESACPKSDTVTLLARNDAPDIRCDCGQPAAVVEGESMDVFCPACYVKHADEDNEGGQYLALLNSPRAGQCGYGMDELESHLKKVRKQAKTAVESTKPQ